MVSNKLAIAGFLAFTTLVLGTVVYITHPSPAGVEKAEDSKPVAMAAAKPVEPTAPPVSSQPAAPVNKTAEPVQNVAPPAGPPQPRRVAAAAPATPAASPMNPAEVEPLAREALNSVGVDPVAEAVWSAAINDPAMPPKARKNLIEDLNENGFADPNHPTPDELPLIVSRLQLIEQMAPDAIDDTNAAAFQEAYKDLVNMYARLTREGQA